MWRSHQNPFFTPFFIVPLFKRERIDREHAKEKEKETMVYRLYQRIHRSLSLSLAFCIDSKKYYNLCLAGTEKYNSLFRRVYKEDDTGCPHGWIPPASPGGKRVKNDEGKGDRPSQTRTVGKFRTKETIFYLILLFSRVWVSKTDVFWLFLCRTRYNIRVILTFARYKINLNIYIN